MLLRRFLLPVIVGLLFAGAVRAAAPGELRPHRSGTPFLRTWTAEDYDASAVNWDVATHPNGFIYVGNNAGVLEFDGARWRTLPLPRGGRAGAVVVDAQGRIWAGGHDELVIFEPDATGTLRARALAELLPPDNERIGTINRALSAPDGVYLSSISRLYRFRGTGPDFHVDVWKSDDRFAALFALDGATHVQTATALLRVEGNALRPVTIPQSATAARYTLNQRRPFTARTLSAGAHVLLTAAGPFRWRGPGFEVEPLSAETAALFGNESAQAASFLPEGRMAFAMTRSGLLILDAEGNVERRIDRTHGLPHNRIQALMADAQGGVWLALHYGLARLQLDSPLVLHGAAQGVEGGSRRFARQWDRLYVANGEGLARRDPITGRFAAVEGLRTGANRLLALDDRLLVTSGGLKEVSRDDRARPWWNGVLYGVEASRRQPGWLIAGGPIGLSLFAPTAGTPPAGWTYFGRVERLAFDIETLHDTGDGFVWVASQAGEIFRADFRAGLGLGAPVERFGPDRGVPALRHSENVQLFTLDGALCASSPDWLLRFDPATQRFVPETRIPGFGADRGATAVHATSDRDLWLLAQQGAAEIVHAVGAAPAWRTSRWPIGPLAHLTVNSLFADPAGRTLWIAGQGALVSFDFDWNPSAAPPPARVHVRRVQALDGTIFHGGGGPEPAAGDLRLPPTHNALRFEFAAPLHAADFSARSRTMYRTRLDGVDSAWSGWGYETHREFTGLPFRDLVFHVQARDLQGNTTPETRFSFAVLPPWWLTRWAWAGYAVAAFAVMAAIVLLRTRALHRRARRLEGVVAERTEELQRRNAELARLHRLELDEKTAAQLAEQKAQLEMLRYQLNPHFLFNALNSIYSEVYPHSEAAGETVRRLSDFCRATLARTDADWHSFAQELTMLRSYLDIEQARWRDRLRIEITPDVATLRVMLPAFLLLPLVENAIKHGGATSQGVLTIRLASRRLDETTIELSVANTGTWRSVERPRPPTSIGIGMENLHARLARCFPDAHRVSLDAENGWVRVSLRLTTPDKPATLPPAQAQVSAH